MSRLIEDEVRNRQNGVHHGLGDDEMWVTSVKFSKDHTCILTL